VADVIRLEDLFDKDSFERILKYLNEIKAALDELEKAYIKFAQLQGDSIDSKSYSDAVIAVNNLKNAVSALIDIQKKKSVLDDEMANIQKAQERLTKQLNKTIQDAVMINNENYKTLLKLKVANKDLAQELKAAAKSAHAFEQAEELLEKANKNLFESYHDLTDTLENLRIIYKDLAAAGKFDENTERVLAAIKKLDNQVKIIDSSVGQYYKNVGDYANDISSAIIANIASVSSESNAFASSFKTVFSAVNQSVANLITSLANVRSATEAATVAAFNLRNAFKSIAIAFAIDLAIKSIEYLIERFKTLSEEEKKRLLISIDLAKSKQREYEIEQQINSLAIEYADKTISFYKDYIKLVNALYMSKIEAAENEIRLIKESISNLEREIENASSYAEKQNKILELENKKVELQKANADLQSIILEKREKERQINETIISYQNKLKDFAEMRVGSESEIAQMMREYLDNVSKIKSLADELRRFYDDSATSIKISNIEMQKLFELKQNLLDRLREIYERYTAISFELYAGRAASNAILEIERMIFDVVSKRASIEQQIKKNAEAIAALRKNNLNDEAAALEAINAELSNIAKNYKDTTAIVYQEFLKRTAEFRDNLASQFVSDLDKRIFELQKQRDKMLDAIKRDEEILKSLAERLKAENKDAEYKDALDILQFYEQQRVKIINETEAEIASIKDEYRKKQIKAEVDARMQILEHQKRMDDLELTLLLEKSKRFGDYTDTINLMRLQKEIEYLKNRNEILSRIENEAAKDEIEENKKKIDILVEQYDNLQREVIRKKIDAISKSFIELASNLNNIIKKSADLRIRQYESSLNFLTSQAEFLSKAIEAGVAGASDLYIQNLEAQKQMQAKMQEENAKAARREAFLAVLKAFTSVLEQSKNVELAFANASSIIARLSSLVSSLPAFSEGTEYVSSKHENKFLKSKYTRDTVLARIEVGERIIPRHLNAKIAGVKNEDLVNSYINKKADTERVYIDYDKLLATLVYIVENKDSKKIQRIL